MKIIALGDIHGRTVWKKIVEKETFDKIIFIGDYFDSKEGITPQQQLDNFKAIIQFKKNFKQKVILLIGNHDFHYLKTTDKRYSGFQQNNFAEFSSALHAALDSDLIQVCHVANSFVFTHAGITKTWYKNVFGKDNPNIETLQLSLNDMFLQFPELFKFTPGQKHDRSGNEPCQTPLWVRPQSLIADAMDNCTQIVGHTIHEKLTINNNIAFIDTLGTSGEYLYVAKNQLIIKNQGKSV